MEVSTGRSRRTSVRRLAVNVLCMVIMLVAAGFLALRDSAPRIVLIGVPAGLIVLARVQSSGATFTSTTSPQGFTGGIMIVTARGLELDRVVGLDLGADDYMSKPFSLAELQARVRALLRRAAPAEPSAREPGAGLRVDRAGRRAHVGGAELALTGKEFDVLALLAAEPEVVVARERLMSEVWDENWFGSTRTLDVTIGRLRQKFEEAGAAVRVTNVRGVGFRLENAVERA